MQTIQTRTVSSLKESGFYLVKELIENSASAIEMLNYIDFLSQLNAVDVGNMELPIDGNQFKLTKSDITRLFFSHIEDKKGVIEAKMVAISESALEAMRDKAQNNKDRMRCDQLQTVNQHIRNARSHARNQETELNSATEIRKRLDSVSDLDPKKAINDVVDGLKKTNWNFLEFDDYRQVIKFVSRSDIILQHSNPAAGLSYEINCGQFKLSIGLRDMSVNLVGHKNCVKAEDDEEGEETNIHPNISEGYVCWGSASETIEEAKVCGNILKVLQVLDALLPNYGQPPYVDIETFKKETQNRDERLRREREQEEKAPQAAEGPHGEEDFVESDDFDDSQYEFSEGGESDEQPETI